MHKSQTALTFLVIVGVVIYSGDPSEGSKASTWREKTLFHQAFIGYCVPPSVHHRPIACDSLNFHELRMNKQKYTSILRIRGGMEGGTEDNVGWGNVDMNAADDDLDLGEQGAEQAWPEQVSCRFTC